RTLVRTTRYPTSTPRPRSSTTAADASFNELRIDPNASGCDSACSKWLSVSSRGRTDPYHVPGTDSAVSTTPTCGSSASPVTTANSPVATPRIAGGSDRSPDAREALEYIAYALPPRVSFPSTYTP